MLETAQGFPVIKMNTQVVHLLSPEFGHRTQKAYHMADLQVAPQTGTISPWVYSSYVDGELLKKLDASRKRGSDLSVWILKRKHQR